MWASRERVWTRYWTNFRCVGFCKWLLRACVFKERKVKSDRDTTFKEPTGISKVGDRQPCLSNWSKRSNVQNVLVIVFKVE